MTIYIKLDNKYVLTSDSKQYIIAQKDEKRMDYLTFHTSIESAILSYFDMKTRGCNTESINSLLEYQKSLLTALNKALQPLKIKIERFSEVENKKNRGCQIEPKNETNKN